MPETINVLLTAVWENKAKVSGKPFWRAVADVGEERGVKFTAFDRSTVACLIDGLQPTQAQGSLVWNYKPPKPVVFTYEPKDGGPILTQVFFPVEQPGPTAPVAAPATDPGKVVGTPPGLKGSYKGGYSGGAKKDWKPADERPKIVTMCLSYAKDQADEIIAHSADLEKQDPDAVVKWATDTTLKLAQAYQDYTLAQLQKLGYKLESEK